MFANAGDPRALLKEAQSLQALGRLDEASQKFQLALMAAPSNPRILMGFAALEAKRKRPEKALDLARRCVKASPNDAHAWTLLADLASRKGLGEESLSALERAIALRAGDDALLARRAAALAALERNNEACEAFRDLAKRRPEDPTVLHNLGNVQMRLKDYAGAESAFRAAVALDGGDARFHYGFGRAKVYLGDYAGGVASLGEALRLGPYKIQAISYMIVALRHLGRREEADALEGLDTLIAAEWLDPPDGFASLDEFNSALTEEILNHPRLTAVGDHRATRNGAKLDNMFDRDPSPLFKGFEVETLKAFDRFLAKTPRDATHPLPIDVKGGYKFLHMWSNIMHQGGHQVPHNHLTGWFSGCYYNLLPSGVDAGDGGREGWIEFGGAPSTVPAPADAPVRQVKPEPGMLVVFPSYVFHRTVPFESDEIRISAACDARPVNWPHPFQ